MVEFGAAAAPTTPGGPGAVTRFTALGATTGEVGVAAAFVVVPPVNRLLEAMTAAAAAAAEAGLLLMVVAWEWGLGVA